MRKLEIYSLVVALVAAGLASKCPERRKPHPTSCTIFYNCVNLPGGGYVWAPAKCTNGLVFQPYLRICVLPGDSWTCDILATEPPETTTKQIPELLDSTQTSYLGYGQDEVPSFSEPMDYYKLDSLPATVTPYPLIEVTQPYNYVSQIDSTIKNLGLPIAIKHSEDNYLYHFVNGQQVLATPINANSQQLQAHLQHLIQLIERLTAYQGSGIPLDRQPQSSTTTSTATRLKYGNNLNGYLNEDQESGILNFLIKNYVLKSQAQSTTSFPEPEAVRTTGFSDQEFTTMATDALGLLTSGQHAGDNIVLVRDSLNNRQYFTVNKYKSIAHQLTTETVELVPCTSGVRLPNSTDCTKYYSCEPATAKVRQYSCPSNTAFNKYKRLCERNEFIRCTDEGGSTLRNYPATGIPKSSESLVEFSETNPCQTSGKHEDPTSNSHYYFCYSDGGKSGVLKFQRMACPNSLVFCHGKNVCTTRKRCEEY